MYCEQLQAPVEQAALDQFERDVGVAVIDAVLAGGPRDHGEQDDAEPIDKTRGEQ